MAPPSLPKIPEELWRLMAQVGPVWGRDTRGHIKLMIERFSEVLRDSPRDYAEVRRDIAYGDHVRQRFEVFIPNAKAPDPHISNISGKRPALVFVHGGAFTEGSRNRTTEIYSNVLHYFARFGVLGVNTGYRLAPEFKYPEATRDIASVVNWVRSHADEFSVDTSRIFLMGHSAGAAHAGSYAYDSDFHPTSGHGLAGLIVVSGRVRADNRPDNPNARRVEDYYGTDPAVLDRVSPVTKLSANAVRTFIAFAEFENPLIDVYCLELAYRLAAVNGRSPHIMRMLGHNHTSIIGHFNTAEDRLGLAIRRFMGVP
jgi:acetyl esterase/lipase